MYTTSARIAGEVKEQTTAKNAKREPVWNKRISKTAEWYGKDLAILNELKNNIPTRQVCPKANHIFKKSKMKENVEEMEQNFEMKLQTKAQRLRGYSVRSNYYQQNNLFN
jgi:hypothetical protein